MSYNIFSCLTVNHSWLSHLTIFDLPFYSSPNPHLLISLEYEPHNHQKQSQKKLPRSKETFTSQFPGHSLVCLNGLYEPQNSSKPDHYHSCLRCTRKSFSRPRYIPYLRARFQKGWIRWSSETLVVFGYVPVWWASTEAISPDFILFFSFRVLQL